jgi:heat shock protein HtpX
VPHRLANALQTLALLAAMAALAGYLGWVLFGADGLFAAAVLALLAAAFGPQVSPRLVLRLSGAMPLAPSQAPGLYRLVAALAERAGLPRLPRLWYVPTAVMNAFATGRPEDGAIAVTDGLLRRLAPRELAGVLAHEVAHLAANDVWVMTLADVVGRMTGVLSLFGQMLLVAWLPAAAISGAEVPIVPIAVMVLAPVASALLQLALSRTREYDADARAAELTGDPRGLAAALEKLERLQGGWLERLFMARPPRWLRTHPETAERIRRLAEIERAQRRESAAVPWEYREDPFFGGPEIRRRPRWHWSGLWY